MMKMVIRGVWVGHYETGELKYEGNFIDGEVGCFHIIINLGI